MQKALAYPQANKQLFYLFICVNLSVSYALAERTFFFLEMVPFNGTSYFFAYMFWSSVEYCFAGSILCISLCYQSFLELGCLWTKTILLLGCLNLISTLELNLNQSWSLSLGSNHRLPLFGWALLPLSIFFFFFGLNK